MCNNIYFNIHSHRKYVYCKCYSNFCKIINRNGMISSKLFISNIYNSILRKLYYPTLKYIKGYLFNVLFGFFLTILKFRLLSDMLRIYFWVVCIMWRAFLIFEPQLVKDCHDIINIMISPTTTCTNRMKLTIFHGLTFRTIAEGFY